MWSIFTLYTWQLQCLCSFWTHRSFLANKERECEQKRENWWTTLVTEQAVHAQIWKQTIPATLPAFFTSSPQKWGKSCTCMFRRKPIWAHTLHIERPQSAQHRLCKTSWRKPESQTRNLISQDWTWPELGWSWRHRQCFKTALNMCGTNNILMLINYH